MIEEINSTSAAISKTSKPDDPVTLFNPMLNRFLSVLMRRMQLSQIVRILNGHLSQLQIIDQGAAELQAKVAAAQREGQRLGSRNRSLIGGGSDAADDFYRSYMR